MPFQTHGWNTLICPVPPALPSPSGASVGQQAHLSQTQACAQRRRPAPATVQRSKATDLVGRLGGPGRLAARRGGRRAPLDSGRRPCRRALELREPKWTDSEGDRVALRSGAPCRQVWGQETAQGRARRPRGHGQSFRLEPGHQSRR